MYFAGGFSIKEAQDLCNRWALLDTGTVWTLLLPCPSCDAVILSLSSPHAPAKPLYHNCSSSHLLVQMDLFSFKNWYQELEFVFSPPSTSHLSPMLSPLARAPPLSGHALEMERMNVVQDVLKQMECPVYTSYCLEVKQNGLFCHLLHSVRYVYHFWTSTNLKVVMLCY